MSSQVDSGIIIFKGKEYPIRNINGNIIATESLNNALFHEGVYTSGEAVDIDEDIFFYVPDEAISLSNKNLIAVVEEGLGEPIGN